MELVIRMKTVARFLLFTSSLVVWLILLSFAQRATHFQVFSLAEESAILGAFVLAGVQTWGLARALRT